MRFAFGDCASVGVGTKRPSLTAKLHNEAVPVRTLARPRCVASSLPSVVCLVRIVVASISILGTILLPWSLAEQLSTSKQLMTAEAGRLTASFFIAISCSLSHSQGPSHNQNTPKKMRSIGDGLYTYSSPRSLPVFLRVE
jgi:hypothetical protein